MQRSAGIDNNNDNISDNPISSIPDRSVPQNGNARYGSTCGQKLVSEVTMSRNCT